MGASVWASAPLAFAAGANAFASGNHSVAIGGGEHIGEGPVASGASALALGERAVASGAIAAVAVGVGATATAAGAFALGRDAAAIGTDAVAIGAGAESRAEFGVALGAASTVLPDAVGAVAFGGAVAAEPRSLVANGRAFASDFVLADFDIGASSGDIENDDATAPASLSAALRAVAELLARVEALEAAAAT